MIDTLIKIGKWQAAGMKPVERFLARPKLKEGKTYYTLSIVFDLDEHKIHSDILKKYSEKDPLDFLLVKTLPRRNKKIYCSVLKDKFQNLLISFFGKLDTDLPDSDLYSKAMEVGAEEDFLNLLNEISLLKALLIEKLKNDNDNSTLDVKKLLGKLNKGEDIAMIIAAVKAEKYGFTKPYPISKLPGYIKFINNIFLKEKTGKDNDKKLCYATGKYSNDVKLQELKEENVNLNKMFGAKTYLNYAQAFDIKNYYRNYQASTEAQKYLDLGSKFLLQNNFVDIAGIRHVIIPTFLANTEVDFEMIFYKSIKKQTDYLFLHNNIKSIKTDIEDEVGNKLYWLNFLSYTTDGGQTFKTTNLIKDVSIPYFVEIIKTLDRLNNYLAEQYGSNTFYNFYQFYNYIPVKKGTNKNEALELFKDIFEHRKIDKTILFKHFVRYMIVQRSGQFDNSKKHRAYANIREQGSFDYAIFNGVMTYLVFLKFLRIVKLLNNNDMEENIENLKPIEEVKTDYRQSIEKFFADMQYNDMQKGLFFLGRVLSQVAYAQAKSNHPTKPVLNKINYNGMDRDAIMRLELDLAEKVRQYVRKINLAAVEQNFSKFTHYFNPNNREEWLTPEENVFYLLSGYSFGMIKTNENSNDKENPKKINKIITS